MTDYVPPVSPEINLIFKGTAPYAPPVSPEVNLIFGAEDSGPSLLAANNFMIILTM